VRTARPRVVALAAMLLALALTGCESTAERSAQLERVARHAQLSSERGLTIARVSRYAKVLSAQILHAGESTAAVIVVRNASTHALRDVPIAVTVRDARGGTLYQNNAPGLEAALTEVPLLPAGGKATWVDDQVQASGTPTSVTAVLGEAPNAPASIPRLRVSGVHTTEGVGSGPGASGTVVNPSGVTQQSLVVYALARRDGRIVAAGRALVPEIAAHRSSSFELFFVGNPHGAQLELSAPPSTF
jgi:hypothetical protein